MTALLEERLKAPARTAATAVSEEPDAVALGERIAASLEAIASELERIRAHLDEVRAESSAVGASSGPWLRHPPRD